MKLPSFNFQWALYGLALAPISAFGSIVTQTPSNNTAVAANNSHQVQIFEPQVLIPWPLIAEAIGIIVNNIIPTILDIIKLIVTQVRPSMDQPGWGIGMLVGKEGSVSNPGGWMPDCRLWANRDRYLGMVSTFLLLFFLVSH